MRRLQEVILLVQRGSNFGSVLWPAAKGNLRPKDEFPAANSGVLAFSDFSYLQTWACAAVALELFGKPRREGRPSSRIAMAKTISASPAPCGTSPAPSFPSRPVANSSSSFAAMMRRGNEHKGLRKMRVQAYAGCARSRGACDMLSHLRQKH